MFEYQNSCLKNTGSVPIDVTLKRGRLTIFAFGKQYVVQVCVCSIKNSNCKAHTPCYIAVTRLALPHFFPLYLIKETVFFGGGGGGFSEHKMCVFIVSTSFV